MHTDEPPGGTVVAGSRSFESTLIEADQRFATLTDGLPLGVVVLDATWCVAHWNPEAERLFGWRAIEVAGRQAPIRFEDGRAFDERGEGLDPGTGPLRFEGRCRRRDGALLDAAFTFLPIPGVAGQAGGCMVLIEEAGERRRAEEQLQLRDRALAAASNAIIIVDARLPGRPIVSVNAAFERITGYSAAETIGRNARFLQGPASEDAAIADLARAEHLGIAATVTLLNYRKNGEAFWNELTLSPVISLHGEVTHFVGVMQDVTERRQAQDALEHLAFYDPVTDLPNRTLLRQRTQMAIAQAREQGRQVALLVANLRSFDELEKLGPGIPDLVLQVVGSRLLTGAPSGSTVARLRGDQFAVLLFADGDGAVTAARNVIEVLERGVAIEELALHVEGSVGIAVYPEHALDASNLVRCAETAARQAEGAAAPYAMYSAEADRRDEALSLLGELRPAIEDEELTLHYQPEVEAASGRPMRVEALVRWQHPKRGLIMPGQFVVAAERSSLIRPLTLWVVKSALAQLRSWLDTGLDIGVAVNLSARNLHDQRLVADVAALLERFRVPAQLLTLEITESALMADLVRGTEGLRRLKELGLAISVDDFGTGYSSFAYLRGDLVDEIKIDRSFVDGVTRNRNDLAIVRSVVHLGHDLGLRVVAEGAETAAHLSALVELGCDMIQGYYIARPGPPETIEPSLRGITMEGAA
jgi:PAS domain S-box-containing protein/diguanylate cyclase (GGDEF)-like protein